MTENYKVGSLGNIKDMLQKVQENSHFSYKEGIIDSATKADDGIASNESEEKDDDFSAKYGKPKSEDSKKEVQAEDATSSKSVNKTEAIEEKPKKESKEKVNGKPRKAEKESSNKPSPSEELPVQSNGLDNLWSVATALKGKEFPEKQVWLSKDLCLQIENLNLICGKPAPFKHVVNAILKLFLDEHKTEITKVIKSRK